MNGIYTSGIWGDSLAENVNPILDDIRMTEPLMRPIQIRYWMGSVPTHIMASMPTGYWYTLDQLNHARRVFTLLATLGGDLS